MTAQDTTLKYAVIMSLVKRSITLSIQEDLNGKNKDNKHRTNKGKRYAYQDCRRYRPYA